jgi:small conductance mechanosensitive channel
MPLKILFIFLNIIYISVISCIQAAVVTGYNNRIKEKAMQNMVDQIVLNLGMFGMNVIGAICILILGRIAAGIIKKVILRVFSKTKTDKAVTSFVANISYFAVLIFAILAALAKFGIQTTSFVAVLGAAGLAIGLALQGTLSNFAAGVMLLILRPFRIGDYIEGAGVAGTVKELDLFTTVLATVDNVKIMVPNAKLFTDVIKNISGYDLRRIDLEFGIGYTSPIDKARDILTSLVKEDSRILSDPPAEIAVSALRDSSVTIVFRPWVKRENYWDVRFDLMHKVKDSFEKNGIEIPFPQQVVYNK